MNNKECIEVEKKIKADFKHTYFSISAIGSTFKMCPKSGSVLILISSTDLIQDMAISYQYHCNNLPLVSWQAPFSSLFSTYNLFSFYFKFSNIHKIEYKKNHHVSITSPKKLSIFWQSFFIYPIFPSPFPSPPAIFWNLKSDQITCLLTTFQRLPNSEKGGEALALSVAHILSITFNHHFTTLFLPQLGQGAPLLWLENCGLLLP